MGKKDWPDMLYIHDTQGPQLVYVTGPAKVSHVSAKYASFG